MAIFIVAHLAFGRAVLFFLLFLVFLAPRRGARKTRNRYNDEYHAAAGKRTYGKAAT
jgi:hypothetical protein